jgi:phage virion morphogenesis protein
MAGVEFTLEIDSREIDTAIAQLHKLSADFTPLMASIGNALVSNTRDRFKMGRDPDNHPWKALLPSYARIKEGPSILIGLGMNGGLQESITSLPSNHQVAIGSNKIYAAVHQFGATIVPVKARALVFRLADGVVFAKQVTVPARPYLGFSDADRESVLVTTDHFLQRVITGQPWPTR